MKKIALLFLCISMFSCDTDDDLPELNEIIYNFFSYGEDATWQQVSKSFNSNPIEVTPGVFRTNVLITDNNFDAPDGVVESVGFAIELTLFGNFDAPLQPGIYSINNDQEAASAFVSYSLNYDTDQFRNAGTAIESGRVIVEPYSTDYYIQIDGVDTEGNAFHGNFFGNSATFL